MSAEVATGGTRADIVLELGIRTIVIEAKIDAAEGQTQGKRLEDHWPDADPLVFLTTGTERRPTTAGDRNRWRWISWHWLAQTTLAHLAEHGDAPDRRSSTSREAVRSWAESVKRSLR